MNGSGETSLSLGCTRSPVLYGVSEGKRKEKKDEHVSVTVENMTFLKACECVANGDLKTHLQKLKKTKLFLNFLLTVSMRQLTSPHTCLIQ